MAKRYHKHPQVFRPSYFLILTIISAFICLQSLRANNEHMIKLRNDVYTADKNNDNVEGTLRALQVYVTSNMNTNLSAGPNAVYPPIQLKYTYDRLVAAQSNQLAQTNTQLYTAAQGYCEQQDSVDFSGHNRVPCIEQYVQQHDASLPAIPDALYKFDFVSPVWSPDRAGWSLVVAISFAIITVGSFVYRRFLKTDAQLG